MPVSPNHANQRDKTSAVGVSQQQDQQQQDLVLNDKTPQEFKRQLHDHMAEKEKEQALEARRHAQAVAQTAAEHAQSRHHVEHSVLDDATDLMHRAARTGEALRDAGASELGAIPPAAHHEADQKPALHMVDLDAAALDAKRKAAAAAPQDDDVAAASFPDHRHRHHRHRGAERKAALREAIFRSPGFTSALNWPQRLLAPLGQEARQALGFFLVLVLPIAVAYWLLFSSFRPTLPKFERFIQARSNRVSKKMKARKLTGGGGMPAGAWDDAVGTCWVTPEAATAAWTQPSTFSVDGHFVHCDPLTDPNGKCYMNASTGGAI